MREAILDSDMLSYVMDQRDPIVSAISRQYLRSHGHFTTTVLTMAEIIEGLVQADDSVRLSRFFELSERYSILSVDTEEAILAGRIMGTLAQRGQKIGDLDPFIAAVAITNGLPLVTNNARHYERIVALGFPLELENWRRIDG